MDFFRETTFWPWCCPLKILHTLPRLASAHPKVGWGPPKKCDRENLKFGLIFSVLRSITSGLVAVSSRDFFQSMSREAGVITWVHFLQGPSPKIFDGKKFGSIFDNLWLWSRISSERINISKIGIALENLQPSHVGRKQLGVLWSTNEKVIDLNKFTS